MPERSRPRCVRPLASRPVRRRHRPGTSRALPRPSAFRAALLAVALLLVQGPAGPGTAAAQAIVEIGGEGRNCNEDPECFNRIHPAIPMVVRAAPGATLVFHARNAGDLSLDPEAGPDPRGPDARSGTVHPITGPVHIEGARRGDVLKVRLLDIAPGPFAETSISSIGFVSDEVEGPFRVLWRLDRDYAESDDLPGVRIPNASFPGILTTLPGPDEHAAMMAREAALAEAGGVGWEARPFMATPEAVCGEGGSHADACLRTIPPREHGGNMDIRYLKAGATVYLPCFVDGCGLGIGDLHFAQGDGEVSGTALEMDATVTLTTEIVRNGPDLSRGPHYEGPATLLDIPSRRFWATTGFPLKEAGEVPPDMEYLESPTVAGLENLSKDVSLASRNALLAMIDHISETYGYTRQQAYILASVAVDLRIGQLVDAPNVGVTAILPLDIFVDPPRRPAEDPPR